MAVKLIVAVLGITAALFAAAFVQHAPPARQEPAADQGSGTDRPAVPGGTRVNRVDFMTDIHPILQAHCAECHGDGARKGGFQIDSRELILEGGKSGAAAVPGDAEKSLLISLVSGADPERIMPKDRPRLRGEQIDLLRQWIDEGLTWSTQAPKTAAKSAKAYSLELNPPRLPAAGVNSRLANPIDRLLSEYFENHDLEWEEPVPDRLFIRRAYLDIVGMLPTPEDLVEFALDTQADKRRRLVRALLADRRRYAEHWLTFWNDALRNDYRGTGYIDGGRRQITQWLFNALYDNVPYDRFVRELVAPPTEDTEGFINGILWRGVVNASQTPEMQAAQNISQVFLGANIKCASCHDSFINDWKLSDAYGLAAVFATSPLEMHRCDTPIGAMAEIGFLYPQLGSIDANACRCEREAQLAGLLTSPRNGRFARTIVNRLWARFFGRGLVEPVDEMDENAWSPELLDWLAADMIEHGWDLKHTIELMLTSQAYQLPASPATEQIDAKYVFRGPVVRRMSAEQFCDAVRSVTGVWRLRGDARVSIPRREPSEPLDAKWIWSNADAATDAPDGPVYLRKEFELERLPANAVVVAACDNSCTLYVNGTRVGAGRDFGRPDVFEVDRLLVVGRNVVAVEAVNTTVPRADGQPRAANPAGFIGVVRLFYGLGKDAGGAGSRDADWVHSMPTDESWLCSGFAREGWTKAEYVADGWKRAAEVGPPHAKPWSVGDRFLAAVPDVDSFRHPARSALLVADPLMTALGRPNREQVVTNRATAATTLQALELTNGATLDELLRRAARIRLERGGTESDLVEQIFLAALGRRPNPDELGDARELIGSPATEAGVSDLLWVIMMLPEFQLIY